MPLTVVNKFLLNARKARRFPFLALCFDVLKNKTTIHKAHNICQVGDETEDWHYITSSVLACYKCFAGLFWRPIYSTLLNCSRKPWRNNSSTLSITSSYPDWTVVKKFFLDLLGPSVRVWCLTKDIVWKLTYLHLYSFPCRSLHSKNVECLQLKRGAEIRVVCSVLPMFSTYHRGSNVFHKNTYFSFVSIYFQFWERIEEQI